MKEEGKIPKLMKFIIDNDLNFAGTGSELNSECCIISGYALFIEADMDDIDQAIDSTRPDACAYWDELGRVFDFARSNDYGTWWGNKYAKSLYKF